MIFDQIKMITAKMVIHLNFFQPLPTLYNGDDNITWEATNEKCFQVHDLKHTLAGYRLLWGTFIPLDFALDHLCSFRPSINL
jgi:hypothetical protein